MTQKEFLTEGRYLPEFLRDFHDQKRVFKEVHVVLNRRLKHSREKERVPHICEGLTWVQAHVYVIDFFLWFMANHGYTLQKTRVRVPYHDVKAMMEEGFNRDLKVVADAGDGWGVMDWQPLGTDNGGPETQLG